ncbi:hypothetical protein CHS0354_019527 [Potamilus streckersoni]|uniref:Uncharacterized protein n=1 Tax=Potamilus streckersoni TaxID=2493646 RepID=A0AAE0SGT1_9BIVA|nr:hypothetical protein CHS0354_019527 [Potamilus streckersoni]
METYKYVTVITTFDMRRLESHLETPWDVPIVLANVIIYWNKENALSVNETSVHEHLEAISRGSTGQDKLNYLPPRSNGRLDDNETTDKSRQLKKNYNVKVAILIDSGVWDL